MQYQTNGEFNLAISFFKKWESELLKGNEMSDLRSCYKLLSDNYAKINDSKNSQLYNLKFVDSERKLNAEFSNDVNDEIGDWRIYCYTSVQGVYKMKLDDNSKKVKYILYKNNVPSKVMTGTWELKDEGVYGPTYKLTISWDGVNSSMPEMKFIAQYDGSGELQGLIDIQNRTWNKCK